MKFSDFIEIFFVVATNIAMPFILLGNYFTFFHKEKRREPLAILFLIVTVFTALFHVYFAWQTLKKHSSWERIIKKS